jgi:hypothetical protein
MIGRSNVVMGVAVAASVFVSGMTWHGLRQEARLRNQVSAEVAKRLNDLTTEWERVVQRSGSSSRVLEEVRSDMNRLLAAQLARSSEPLLPLAATQEDELSGALQGEMEAPSAKQAGLSPLPAEVEAKSPWILQRFRKSMNISEILENPAINPEQKQPDYLQTVRIIRELTQANAQIDIVSSDYRLKMAEARTKLAGVQQFIDYARGEKYLIEKGVLTFGEKTETGQTRIYYLYPEEFPEVYELRERRRAIPNESLRKVRDLLQECDTATKG